jgi:hypothetical protein
MIIIVPRWAFFNEHSFRRWYWKHDESQRSTVANAINQRAIVRETSITKARNLQSKLLVDVKSISQPDKILVVKPEVIEIIFAIDEIRNRKVHEFERRRGRDKTRQLSRLPIVPKRKIKIEK